MKAILKENKIKVLLAVLYAAIIAPLVYSIYYSVPCADDFAFGSNTVSDNLFINAVGYSAWNWQHWTGRWLLFFLQKLINPMNAHVHLGHVYGAWMIVVFLLTLAIIGYCVKKLLSFILRDKTVLVSIATFIAMSLLLTCYYYCEVFNWYIGATAYAIPMALLLLTYTFMLDFSQTGSKRAYIGMIIAGILPATNEAFDVPLGMVYIYLIFIRPGFERKLTKENIKKLIPLLIYVVLGCSVVFSPGTAERRAYYGVQTSAVRGIVQLIIDLLVRVQDLIVDHPFAVLLLLNLVLIGLISNKAGDKPQNILTLIIVMAITIFGSLAPYVIGRGLTNTYIDTRMLYILDYLLEGSLGLLAIILGRWLAYRFKMAIDAKEIIATIFALALFAYLSLIQNYAYLDIVQIDILRNRSLITESYALWDGILAEIESSDDADVVIHRDHELTWSPYFLYSGISDGVVYDVSSDTIYDKEDIMPNVYYGKDSITLYYDN